MSVPASLTEPSQFKNTDEKYTVNLTAKPPQCIVDLPAENPGRNVINDKEWTEAKNVLVNKEYVNLQFPRTMKLHCDPPISGQYIGLISFIPSKGATPDEQGCFGVLKLRGNAESETKADSLAEMIIRQHDSYAIIDYCWVGKPFPLMVDNSAYRAATKEVDIRRKVTEVSVDDLKKKREQEKLDMEDVQRRHRALLADVSEEKETNAHYDDIEMYTALRVKKANIRYRQEDLEKRIAEGKQLYIQVNEEIAKLDQEHPEYKDKCLDKYKEALASSGIDLGQNPLIRYLME